jgi:hypothetical protein
LIEQTRREYEEFIHVTKMENESFKTRQQADFEQLKHEYELYKIVAFEEKKTMTHGLVQH